MKWLDWSLCMSCDIRWRKSIRVGRIGRSLYMAWISNVICHVLFCVQWVKMRGNCSFCSYSEIDRIVVHHCLNFLFINIYRSKRIQCKKKTTKIGKMRTYTKVQPFGSTLFLLLNKWHKDKTPPNIVIR